jgi:hypothetical protein
VGKGALRAPFLLRRGSTPAGLRLQTQPFPSQGGRKWTSTGRKSTSMDRKSTSTESEVHFHGSEVDFHRPEVDFHGSEIDFPGLEVDLNEPEVHFHRLEVDFHRSEVDFHGPEIDFPGLEVERARSARGPGRAGCDRGAVARPQLAAQVGGAGGEEHPLIKADERPELATGRSKVPARVPSVCQRELALAKKATFRQERYKPSLDSTARSTIAHLSPPSTMICLG